MPLNCKRIGKVASAAGMMAAAATLLLVIQVPHASAQSAAENERPAAAPQPAQEVVQTFFLKNAPEQNDLNDIQTDLRNILPRARIYGIASQTAITIKATPEDMETAQKLIADLDRPKPLYRLTYTVTDFDSGKRTGSRSFVILAVLGQRSIFKLGSRVPIVTGSYDSQARNSDTQVQYLDLGMNIEATVEGSSDGLTLRTKIEQSSLSNEKSTVVASDPVIRQTVLQQMAELTVGKPLTIGSLDIPGGTQRQEIEVKAEVVQ